MAKLRKFAAKNQYFLRVSSTKAVNKYGGGGWQRIFFWGGVHFLRESRGNLLLLFDVLSMSFSDNSDQKIL